MFEQKNVAHRIMAVSDDRKYTKAFCVGDSLFRYSMSVEVFKKLGKSLEIFFLLYIFAVDIIKTRIRITHNS